MDISKNWLLASQISQMCQVYQLVDGPEITRLVPASYTHTMNHIRKGVVLWVYNILC
ncbi:hypothetical protein M670_00482 [Schinkia azotoformans MEV2011]|uniref:Uncharacterized protein n=1 Tax=Schinkia azotoformans MEV2011 TaxID=1348973 RepID=A0A072NSK1_SCHAZ|nr:hypothetical protein M670_00482 [Schinkia azotoformans MEV2011]